MEISSFLILSYEKLFFEKGYAGSEKDTIIQETSILVLAAAIALLIALYVIMINKDPYFNLHLVASCCILFIVLANVLGIVYLTSVKFKMMRGAREVYQACNYYRDVPNNGHIEVTFTLLYYFHVHK